MNVVCSYLLIGVAAPSSAAGRKILGKIFLIFLSCWRISKSDEHYSQRYRSAQARALRLTIVPPQPSSESGKCPAYVLILTWSVETTGGVNEVVFALADQVRNRSWHPIIVVASWDRGVSVPEYRGVEVVGLRMREPWQNQKGWRILASFLTTLWTDARALRRFLRDRNVQVLNLHFPGLNAFLPALLKFVGLLPAKLVISLHGADVVDVRNSPPFLKKLWHFIFRQADIITACSGALCAEFQAIFPGLPARTIHNGIDQRLFPRKNTAPNRPPVLLHIGKFEHKKAQDVLLRAFAILLNRDFDLRLRLVGASGPQLRSVEALITELDLTSVVETRVNVPHRDIPALMREADLFVLPSRAEPFGLVLLEAGATGLPVVATKVGGIPELLTDGETGILVPPGDEQALANAIETLLRNTPLSDRLASRFHQQVQTCWSWEQTAAKYLQAVDFRP